MLRCLRKCGQRAWQRGDVFAEWTYNGDYDDDKKEEEVEEEKEYDADVRWWWWGGEREVDCLRLISAQALPSIPYFYFSSSDQTFTFHLLIVILLFFSWPNFYFSSSDQTFTFHLLIIILLFCSWTYFYFSSPSWSSSSFPSNCMCPLSS